jgi:prevent-host-death family protein
MKTIGAYEAKTRLSALLDEVALGEKITITKNGRPVAVLTPATDQAGDAAAVVAALRAFGKGRRLGRATVRSLIDEGRS